MRYSISNLPGAPGNNAGLSDLVYRGGQPSMMPLPYYGEEPAIQQLAQGIPVGQDPRFPMTQEQFRNEMEELRFKNMFPNPGDFRQYIRDYNRQNPLGRQAGVPSSFDAKYVS
jgi:hypothetical protein